MWKVIWTWSVLAFFFTHALAGVVAWANLRDVTKITKLVHLIPFAFIILGLLVPITAGLVTGRLVSLETVLISAAMMVAGVYASARYQMTASEVGGAAR